MPALRSLHHARIRPVSRLRAATLVVAAVGLAGALLPPAQAGELHADHSHAELLPLSAKETGLPAAYNQALSAPSASSYPDFELPFTCAETWRGASRSEHSPSQYSIDFNMGSGDDDLGKPVLAPAAGRVTASTYSTTSGYGNYIVIDHGGYWSTLYAHLNSRAVEVGEDVHVGELIGTVGRTSAKYSFTAHLHFEQRYGNVVQPARFDGASFAYWEQYLTSTNCNRPAPVPSAAIGDVTGDGQADAALWRPTTGRWKYNGAAENVTYGAPGDIPIPADYDGDKVVDHAVYRPSTSAWYFGGAAANVVYGKPGDIPVPADYDGDGDADVAVWRPSTGKFYFPGAIPNIEYGSAGDIPVPADWDGDGDADIAIWRPSNGVWYFPGATPNIVHGARGDIPVHADWDGDGDADIATWRPSTGVWSYASGRPSAVYGLAPGDVPAPANLDSDKAVEIALWRPTTATWYFRDVKPSVSFGASTDLPVSSLILTRPVLKQLRLG